MNQPKLKTVKLTTQELHAMVTLLEGVKVEIKEGLILNAFKSAAEADPDWVEVEAEEKEAPVVQNG